MNQPAEPHSVITPAEDEIPLGIKNPLLGHKPLGQNLLKPNFLYPLGAKPLAGFDSSALFSDQLSVKNLLQEFQDFPFFNDDNSLLTPSSETLSSNFTNVTPPPAPNFVQRFPEENAVKSSIGQKIASSKADLPDSIGVISDNLDLNNDLETIESENFTEEETILENQDEDFILNDYPAQAPIENNQIATKIDNQQVNTANQKTPQATESQPISPKLESAKKSFSSANYEKQSEPKTQQISPSLESAKAATSESFNSASDEENLTKGSQEISPQLESLIEPPSAQVNSTNYPSLDIKEIQENSLKSELIGESDSKKISPANSENQNKTEIRNLSPESQEISGKFGEQSSTSHSQPIIQPKQEKSLFEVRDIAEPTVLPTTNEEIGDLKAESFLSIAPDNLIQASTEIKTENLLEIPQNLGNQPTAGNQPVTETFVENTVFPANQNLGNIDAGKPMDKMPEPSFKQTNAPELQAKESDRVKLTEDSQTREAIANSLPDGQRNIEAATTSEPDTAEIPIPTTKQPSSTNTLPPIPTETTPVQRKTDFLPTVPPVNSEILFSTGNNISEQGVVEETKVSAQSNTDSLPYANDTSNIEQETETNQSASSIIRLDEIIDDANANGVDSNNPNSIDLTQPLSPYSSNTENLHPNFLQIAAFQIPGKSETNIRKPIIPDISTTPSQKNIPSEQKTETIQAFTEAIAPVQPESFNLNTASISPAENPTEKITIQPIQENIPSEQRTETIQAFTEAIAPVQPESFNLNTASISSAENPTEKITIQPVQENISSAQKPETIQAFTEAIAPVQPDSSNLNASEISPVKNPTEEITIQPIQENISSEQKSETIQAFTEAIAPVQPDSINGNASEISPVKNPTEEITIQPIQENISSPQKSETIQAFTEAIAPVQPESFNLNTASISPAENPTEKITIQPIQENIPSEQKTETIQAFTEAIAPVQQESFNLNTASISPAENPTEKITIQPIQENIPSEQKTETIQAFTEAIAPSTTAPNQSDSIDIHASPISPAENTAIRGGASVQPDSSADLPDESAKAEPVLKTKIDTSVDPASLQTLSESAKLTQKSSPAKPSESVKNQPTSEAKLIQPSKENLPLQSTTEKAGNNVLKPLVNFAKRLFGGSSDRTSQTINEASETSLPQQSATNLSLPPTDLQIQTNSESTVVQPYLDSSAKNLSAGLPESELSANVANTESITEDSSNRISESAINSINEDSQLTSTEPSESITVPSTEAANIANPLITESKLLAEENAELVPSILPASDSLQEEIQPEFQVASKALDSSAIAPPSPANPASPTTIDRPQEVNKSAETSTPSFTQSEETQTFSLNNLSTLADMTNAGANEPPLVQPKLEAETSSSTFSPLQDGVDEETSQLNKVDSNPQKEVTNSKANASKNVSLKTEVNLPYDSPIQLPIQTKQAIPESTNIVEIPIQNSEKSKSTATANNIPEPNSSNFISTQPVSELPSVQQTSTPLSDAIATPAPTSTGSSDFARDRRHELPNANQEQQPDSTEPTTQSQINSVNNTPSLETSFLQPPTIQTKSESEPRSLQNSGVADNYNQESNQIESENFIEENKAIASPSPTTQFQINSANNTPDSETSFLQQPTIQTKSKSETQSLQNSGVADSYNQEANQIETENFVEENQAIASPSPTTQFQINSVNNTPVSKTSYLHQPTLQTNLENESETLQTTSEIESFNQESNQIEAENFVEENQAISSPSATTQSQINSVNNTPDSETSFLQQPTIQTKSESEHRSLQNSGVADNYNQESNQIETENFGEENQAIASPSPTTQFQINSVNNTPVSKTSYLHQPTLQTKLENESETLQTTSEIESFKQESNQIETENFVEENQAIAIASPSPTTQSQINSVNNTPDSETSFLQPPTIQTKSESATQSLQNSGVADNYNQQSNQVEGGNFVEENQAIASPSATTQSQSNSVKNTPVSETYFSHPSIIQTKSESATQSLQNSGVADNYNQESNQVEEVNFVEENEAFPSSPSTTQSQINSANNTADSTTYFVQTPTIQTKSESKTQSLQPTTEIKHFNQEANQVESENFIGENQAIAIASPSPTTESQINSVNNTPDSETSFLQQPTIQTKSESATQSLQNSGVADSYNQESNQIETENFVEENQAIASPSPTTQSQINSVNNTPSSETSFLQPPTIQTKSESETQSLQNSGVADNYNQQSNQVEGGNFVEENQAIASPLPTAQSQINSVNDTPSLETSFLQQPIIQTKLENETKTLQATSEIERFNQEAHHVEDENFVEENQASAPPSPTTQSQVNSPSSTKNSASSSPDQPIVQAKLESQSSNLQNASAVSQLFTNEFGDAKTSSNEYNTSSQKSQNLPNNEIDTNSKSQDINLKNPNQINSEKTVAQLLSESDTNSLLPTVLENLGQMNPLGNNKFLGQTSSSKMPTLSQPREQSLSGTSEGLSSIIQAKLERSHGMSTENIGEQQNLSSDDNYSTRIPYNPTPIPESWSSIEELLGESNARNDQISVQRSQPAIQRYTNRMPEEDKDEYPEVIKAKQYQTNQQTFSKAPTAKTNHMSASSSANTIAPIQAKVEQLAGQTQTASISHPANKPFQNEDKSDKLEMLAQEIYSYLRQRLEIERERHGRYGSGRLPW